MRRNGSWLIVAILAILLLLFATDTIDVECNSQEADVPEALEEAGENVEDAVDELTGE